MTTAKDYLASMGRRKPNPDEAEELYRLRECDVAKLAKKAVISIEDIHSLEWGGRFKIANEYLDKCDENARESLLHDQHHGVRSAAALFKPAERAAPAPVDTGTSVTDASRAIMNGQERINTSFGMKSCAGIEALIYSTHPLETLTRAESFISGFEGDEQQEGVDELLASLRDAIDKIQ